MQSFKEFQEKHFSKSFIRECDLSYKRFEMEGKILNYWFNKIKQCPLKNLGQNPNKKEKRNGD